MIELSKPARFDGVRRFALSAIVATTFIAGAGPGAAREPGEAFDEWYLRLNGAREAMDASLYVYEFGQGPDVIVLHGGFGGEHSYLLDLARPLADRYHFIFYDQRGSLRSRCIRCVFSVRTHLEDLDALRTNLGIEQATLLGHSMGTYLAMAYAEAHPDNVRGLVLVGAVPAVLTPGETYGQAARDAGFYTRPEIAEQLRLAGVDGPPADMTFKQSSTRWRINYAASNLFDVSRWRQISGGMAYYSETAGAQAAESLPDHWDYRATLCAVPNGASVIMGDHDFLDFREGRWSALQPTLRGQLHYTLVPNAGHKGWIDAPAAYTEALEGALARATKEPTAGPAGPCG